MHIEEAINDLIQKEVRRQVALFIDALSEVVATTPARADGNINARDFIQTLEIVKTRLRHEAVFKRT